MFDADADFNGDVAPCIVSMMETFTAYGHSGGSAEVTLSAFDRLAHFKPLTPLTGADDEWIDQTAISAAPMWQNRRCHEVFKDEDGAWIAKPGKGRIPITFPYTVE